MSATGEAYKSEAACMNGIRSLPPGAPGAKVKEPTSGCAAGIRLV
ncbi:YegP family protein [Streptodolium elevatio]|uniref:YegP family protein n=1 Tax=Streptodolium elevatio TaxID=3157996 RepID=A0ABV3DKQ5_9ACTN